MHATKRLLSVARARRCELIYLRRWNRCRSFRRGSPPDRLRSAACAADSVYGKPQKPGRRSEQYAWPGSEWVKKKKEQEKLPFNFHLTWQLFLQGRQNGSKYWPLAGILFYFSPSDLTLWLINILSVSLRPVHHFLSANHNSVTVYFSLYDIDGHFV